MSAETPKPQPGDKVRVTYEGTYMREVQDGWHKVDVAGYAYPMYPVADSTVEVLERADDPKVGEIRREDHDGGHSIWQVDEHEDGERYWRCTYSTAKGNRGVTFELDRMLDLPVAGAVPGTPAAEARDKANAVGSARPSVMVENTPHGLGDSLRREVAALAAKGHRDDAVDLLVERTVLNEHGARTYVEGMSEYRAYLAQHASEPDETRMLLVHPHLWKSLVAYLDSTRVRVVALDPAGDGTARYGMELMDGEWPS